MFGLVARGKKVDSLSMRNAAHAAKAQRRPGVFAAMDFDLDAKAESALADLLLALAATSTATGRRVLQNAVRML